MNPRAPIFDEPILCPKCDYDLRGQSEAKCPECGSAFKSLEAMVHASMNANRVLRRVMAWRQRLAYFMFPALISFTLGIWMDRSGLDMQRGAGQLLFLPLPIAGACMLALLVQVLRWQNHSLVSLRQREELGSSIAWLAFCSTPFAYLVWVFVSKLL